MTEHRTIETPDAMEALGAEVGRVLRAGDLLVLDGPLGAGKTTFTRGLGATLGVRGPVTSPTFVLARTHPSLTGGPPLVHVDAYRLASPAELDDLDLDYAGSVVVVEWGAGLLDGVADSVLTIAIARPAGGAAGTHPDATTDALAGSAAANDADADAPVEPREVELTGTGPRWATAPWAA